jgi:tetratricopeptide (TPR) repeat protein
VTSLAFSPDGQRLASISPDRPVQLWDVTTGREVLTLPDTPANPACVAFTPDGQRLVLSTAAGWVAIWDAEFLEPEARLRVAAEHDLDSQRRRAAQTHSAGWYESRAWSHAELGHWEEARTDYARAKHLQPEQSHLWYRHAIACLGGGDYTAYHDVCAQMLQRFGDKVQFAGTCIYACAADPKGGGNAEQLVTFGLAALKAQPKTDRRSYGTILRACGAALYRAGRYQEARKALEEAPEYFAPRAWDRLFLAMAYHKCGESDKARDALDMAVKDITAAGQARERDSMWFNWFEQVEVEALRREAETLLGGMP